MMSNISPHIYHVESSGFAAVLEGVTGKVQFPSPLTLNHWIRWYEDFRPKDDEDVEQNFALYRAAFNLAENVEIEGVNLTDIEPMMGDSPNDSTPVAFMSWLRNSLDNYMTGRLNARPYAHIVAARENDSYAGSTYSLDDEQELSLFPALGLYKGSVSFPKVLQAKHLRTYNKERNDQPHEDKRHASIARLCANIMQRSS